MRVGVRACAAAAERTAGLLLLLCGSPRWVERGDSVQQRLPSRLQPLCGARRRRFVSAAQGGECEAWRTLRVGGQLGQACGYNSDGGIAAAAAARLRATQLAPSAERATRVGHQGGNRGLSRRSVRTRPLLGDATRDSVRRGAVIERRLGACRTAAPHAVHTAYLPSVRRRGSRTEAEPPVT